MEKIDIVTVEREYGCGGSEIAKGLSERLGWKLWDHLLTEEIARQAKCPESVVKLREERNDPLHYRLFKAFLRGSFEGSINAHKLKMVDSECIQQFTKRVVEQIAKTGNGVIVGRGSQYFLTDRPGTLRVFLYAPSEDKVRRLIARGKSEAEARDLVETVDRDRLDYIQKYFHVEWPTRWLYHVMINTSVGNETAIEAILDFMKVFAAKR